MSEIADEARLVPAASFRAVVAAESRGSARAESYSDPRVSVNRIAEEHETQRRQGQLVRCRAAGRHVRRRFAAQNSPASVRQPGEFFRYGGSRPEEAPGASSERPLALTEAVPVATDRGPRKLPA